MTDFLRLTKYDSCRGPMGEVFCNPEFIASVERFGEYTRVELAGGTILKVTEQPDDIVERVHFATLGDHVGNGLAQADNKTQMQMRWAM